MQPGHPKIGTVMVGHDNHRGHGYKDAVIDDYPIKFGTISHEPPESSQAPPYLRTEAKRVTTGGRRRRKFFGEK